MRIQMNTLYAGPAGVREVGSVHDVPKQEADALVAGGFAKLVDARQPEPPAPKKPAPEKK